MAAALYPSNVPPGHADPARDPSPDLHGALGRPVHDRSAPVLGSGRHDPPLRRLGRLQPVPQGEVPDRALPAGGSRGHADARQPLRQPDHGRGRPVRPELSPVGQHGWSSTSTARRRRARDPRCPADSTDAGRTTRTPAPARMPRRAESCRGRDSPRVPARSRSNGSPTRIRCPGTRGSGRVVITFQGLINTSQIVSAVSKFIS